MRPAGRDLAGALAGGTSRRGPGMHQSTSWQICAVPTDLCLTRPPRAWGHCANTSCWGPWSRPRWPQGLPGPTPLPSLSGRPDGGGAAWRWTFSPSMVMPTSLKSLPGPQWIQPCPHPPWLLPVSALLLSPSVTLLSFLSCFWDPQGQPPLSIGCTLLSLTLPHSLPCRGVLLSRGGVLDHGGAVRWVDPT